MTIELPRSTPEAQGMPSDAVDRYASALVAAGVELHGLVVVRHGHVVSERHWEPYRPDEVHHLYSVSKSFTSAAVGLAVEEGLFGYDDLVLDHFRESAPDAVDPRLERQRVRHLLTMATGQVPDFTTAVTGSRDWVRSTLARHFTSEPGAEFAYDNQASFLLSSLVRRRSGLNVIDYLRPRLFDPLGIGRVDDHYSPDGVGVGGWGMSVTTESLAAFGVLLLNDGVWKGRRLLPAGWVAEATRSHIAPPAVVHAGPDSHTGYGYQFWLNARGGFRADGVFGQLCVVLPEHDTVVATTAGTADATVMLDAIWDVLLGAPVEGPASDSAPAVTGSLNAPVTAAGVTPPAPGRRRYALESGIPGFDELTVEIGADRIVLDLGGDRIACGLDAWIDAATNLPHTPPEFDFFRPSTPAGPHPLRVRGGWSSPTTLEMRWQYVTSPHHDRVTLRLEGDQAELRFLNSITAWGMETNPGAEPAFPEHRPVLRGTRVA